ncbi:MAG: acyl-CoA thioesterase domain-containing protein [Pseudomonadota bacterium]
MSEATRHLAGEMMQALETAAAETANADVSLVSITLDVTGDIGTAPVTYNIAVDRKTRTLVFLNARAFDGDTPVMTGTAVFAIKAG